MSRKYAVFERPQNNGAAYVPDLPGCITTGQTVEETERHIAEAFRGHLQALRERSERTKPRPAAPDPRPPRAHRPAKPA